MRKYILLAAILGTIVVISVSYMAEAQSQAGTAPPPPQMVYIKDKMECDALADASATGGMALSAEAKETVFQKCMIGKNHTVDEIKKEESLLSDLPTMSAPNTK